VLRQVLQELRLQELPRVLPQLQVLQELPRMQVQRELQVLRVKCRIHHKKLRHREFLFRN
jgi:hypothetical protein